MKKSAVVDNSKIHAQVAGIKRFIDLHLGIVSGTILIDWNNL